MGEAGHLLLAADAEDDLLDRELGVGGLAVEQQVVVGVDEFAFKGFTRKEPRREIIFYT